jgi:hypothetical protein
VTLTAVRAKGPMTHELVVNEIRRPLLMWHGNTEGAAVPTVWPRVGIGHTHQHLRRPPHHVCFQVPGVRAARAVVPR